MMAKVLRMVVRGRELTKELLNNLNDISSTCLRGWQRERRDESKVAGCRKWSRKI